MITPKQQELLSQLKKKPFTNTAELCRLLGISRARLNVLIAPLIRRKMIKKSGAARATVYSLGERRSSKEIRRENWELRQQVRQLEKELEDRKVIERAKELFCAQFDISPAEAYRKMQLKSMESGSPMRQIADGLLQAFDF
jgi:DNA-binding MarR family transcriptional regulator